MPKKIVTKTDLFGNEYQEVVETEDCEALQWMKSHSNPWAEDEPYLE